MTHIATCCLAIALLVGSASAGTIISEGFEGATFPPAGWSVVQTTSYTWTVATDSPAEGYQYATVYYDTALNTQDEWLLSPTITAGYTDLELSGMTFGSPYWGESPYDNYDLKAWIVRGTTAGDGDDTLIGKLDDFWQEEYVWESFTFDLTGLYTVGEDLRLGFQYYGSDGAQAGLDAVRLAGEPLAIPEPSSLGILVFLASIAAIKGRRRK